MEMSKKQMRLDLFLQEKHKASSRSQIQSWIKCGNVFVNGEKAKKCGQDIKNTDNVFVEIPPLVEIEAKPENLPLEIVYQDDDLAVVNKPQGMVVHFGNKNHDKTLVNALLFHIKGLSLINGILRAGIVHRLDKNTSGLLLVAKNDKAYNSLAEQIKQKTCKRKYLAILEGNLKQDSGKIETNIARNKKNPLVMSICGENQGKKAVTLFKVLERFAGNCIVEFELKTGRTHQIRVHCKEVLHHSIVGDKEYGGKPSKLLSKKDEKSQGQYLVAYKIEFLHPTTKKRMSFEIQPPAYFQKLIQKLKFFQKG